MKRTRRSCYPMEILVLQGVTCSAIVIVNIKSCSDPSAQENTSSNITEALRWKSKSTGLGWEEQESSKVHASCYVRPQARPSFWVSDSFCPKIEIWQLRDDLGGELECSIDLLYKLSFHLGVTCLSQVLNTRFYYLLSLKMLWFHEIRFLSISFIHSFIPQQALIESIFCTC